MISIRPVSSASRLTSVRLIVSAWICFVGFAGLAGCRRETPSKEALLKDLAPELRNALEPMQNTPAISFGTDNPEFVSAELVSLGPEEEVVGVLIKNQPFAYPLKLLRGSSNHIVNAHLKMPPGYKVLYSVTYCDLTECVRVLEPDPDHPVDQVGGDSLGLGIQGLSGGELAVTWGGQAYKQRDSIPGLQDFPHQRTTWLQWRASHPKTLVYVGAYEDQE